MAKVKWGILGTAGIAKGCTIPGMLMAEHCELYAIAGRKENKVKDFQEKFGIEKGYDSYQALLEDPEVQAVYVPLPNDLHFPWVMAALKAGKHVLCEKPLAIDADEAEELYRTAQEQGVLLMEAYAYLHSPYIELLKEDVKSGIIGEVNYIDTAFVTQGYTEDFRLYPEHGGGVMYDLGCYCTTMMLSLVDSDPASVTACAEFTDKGVDYMSSGMVRFENGVRASFQVGMNLGQNSNSRFDRLYIHGSKGCIKSDVEYNQEGEVSYKIFTEDGVVTRTVVNPQNYALEVEQLSCCILFGEAPHITPEFSLKNARLLDSLLERIDYVPYTRVGMNPAM